MYILIDLAVVIITHQLCSSGGRVARALLTCTYICTSLSMNPHDFHLFMYLPLFVGMCGVSVVVHPLHAA